MLAIRDRYNSEKALVLKQTRDFSNFIVEHSTFRLLDFVWNDVSNSLTTRFDRVQYYNYIVYINIYNLTPTSALYT